MFVIKLYFINWVSINVKIMEVYMLMEVKLCFLLLYKNNFKRYVYVVVIGTK